MVTHKTSGRDLDLATLQEVLEGELIAREHSRGSIEPTVNLMTSFNCHPQPLHSFQAQKSLPGSLRHRRVYPEAESLFLSHMASECHNVKDLDALQQILRTLGRGFNCLGKGHVVMKYSRWVH